MKLIAGILALIVLVLTVQPAFAFLNASEKTECHETCCGEEAETPAEENQSEGPCSDFCNPFLKCGTCSASTIEFFAFIIQNPVQKLTRHILSTQGVYSQFAADFWQPPRIC